MNRQKRKASSRAFRAAIASALLAASTLSIAHADDQIGIVLSSSPSGKATNTLTLGMPAEASTGTIPIFLGVTGDSTLYGVRLSATPLTDEKGVASVAPTFDHELRTLVNDGALRRVDVTVSGLTALGRFTSTLYATHGNRTQVLGTLSVLHTLRAGELAIAAIGRPRAEQWFPGRPVTLTFPITIRNGGKAAATFSAPVITRLTADGAEATFPAISASSEKFTVAAGDQITLRVALAGIERTGSFSGTLRISAQGHEPVEQAFAYTVKQGPVFPALLIALGVLVAFAIRRRYWGRAIGRAGQKRIVARLQSDLDAARALAKLDAREVAILRSLERRLADVADELVVARVSKSGDRLRDVDEKIDLFVDLVAARRHVATMRPESLRRPFEAQLDEVARFLINGAVDGERPARFAAYAATVRGVPSAAEAAIRGRFKADVDRFLGAIESGSPAVADLPLRALKRIDAARELADEGRFSDARAELNGAQLAFARLLAAEFAGSLPDADAAPPGFATGWPRFRSATVEALKAVRRKGKGADAAEAYRRVWGDYTVELATRLKAAATRERRDAGGARKEQLARVIEDCETAVAGALDLDPAAADAYRLAIEGFLVPPGRRAGPRLRAALTRALIPPPLTVVAASMDDRSVVRPSPGARESAASLTRHLGKRHVSLALLAGLAAIPTGLLLWWAPNETWGELADGTAMFGWGFGLHAVASAIDARRVGRLLARDAATASERRGGRSRGSALEDLPVGDEDRDHQDDRSHQKPVAPRVAQPAPHGSLSVVLGGDPAER